MAFDQHKNLAVSAVLTAPSPATSGTSLVVTATEGARFPAAPFNATVWPASGTPTPINAEVVRVTASAGDTLTIARAQEGTTARSIVPGDLIAATITAKTITDLEGQLTAIVTTWIDLTPTVGIAGGTGTVSILANLGTRYLITGKTITLSFFVQLNITGAPLVITLNLPPGVLTAAYHTAIFSRGGTLFGTARCDPNGASVHLLINLEGTAAWGASQPYVSGTITASLV